MRILLTGFVNFLDHPYNPTETIAHALNQSEIEGHKIVSHILPVSFTEACLEIKRLLEQEGPWGLHVSLGLASKRTKITPEAIAINLKHNPERPDNLGHCSFLEPLQANAPEALLSTLPHQKILNELIQAKLPAEISTHAGAYVCNAVMYQALHALNNSIPSGFVHLPPDRDFYLRQKKEEQSRTALKMEDLILATRLILKASLPRD